MLRSSFHCVILCILLSLSASLPFSFPSLPRVVAASYELNLVYSVNVRGHMLPVERADVANDCSLDEADAEAHGTTTGGNFTCIGGAARRKTFIDKQKQLHDNTIAVDISNYWFGKALNGIDTPPGASIAHFLSLSGYDVIGLGTNDFFVGTTILAGYISSFFPPAPKVIVSNIDVSTTPDLRKLSVREGETVQHNTTAKLLPYWWVERGGRKVGFIGSVPTNLAQSASSGNIVKQDPIIQTLNATVTHLRQEHSDLSIIIVITSADIPEVSEIIQVEHIDVVLCENSPYVTSTRHLYVTTNTTHGRPVLVASTPLDDMHAQFGGSMGNVRVAFDDDGLIIPDPATPSGYAVNGSMSVLERQQFPDDLGLWANVSAYAAQGEALFSRVVGNLTTDLGVQDQQEGASVWCRVTDCNLGRFAASAFFEWCDDCDIAHLNSGGLRKNLYTKNLKHPTNITYGELLDVFPFGNTLVYYQMKGLAFLSRVVQPSLELAGHAGFQQFANLRIAWNPDEKKLVDASVWDRKTQKWMPFDTTKYYRIVTWDWVWNGGDGFHISDSLDIVDSNPYGPAAFQMVMDYLDSANYSVPTLEQLAQCGLNTSFTFIDENGKGNVTWPVDACNMVMTDATISLPDQCPTELNTCKQGGFAYDGKAFNTENCYSCTGLGTCIKDFKKCICDGPTETGRFAGIQMLAGSDCSVVRTEYAFGDGLRGFLYAISAVSILLSILVSIFFFRYRGTKILKRSAPTFLQIACLGAILGAISCVAMIVDTTDASCHVSQWFGNIGFVLLFGALFIKTWRIYAIFGNRRLKTIILTDTAMLLRLGVFLLLEAALRVVEIILSPAHSTATALGECGGSSLQDFLDGSTTAPPNWQYYFSCSSTYWGDFDTFNWSYKAAFTLWGCVLAYLIKDIQADFNESKLLALVIYNMTVFAVIAKVIILFLGGQSPSATLLIEVIAINYVIICTLLGLSVPKWLLIRAGGAAGSMALGTTISKSAVADPSRIGGVRRGNVAEDDVTVNVTMSPDQSQERLTPALFRKSCDSITKRMRTSAADRNNEINLFLEGAKRLVDTLTAIKNSNHTSRGSTITLQSGIQPRPFPQSRRPSARPVGHNQATAVTSSPSPSPTSPSPAASSPSPHPAATAAVGPVSPSGATSSDDVNVELVSSVEPVPGALNAAALANDSPFNLTTHQEDDDEDVPPPPPRSDTPPPPPRRR